MPVTWQEVHDGVPPNAFPIGDQTTLKRLAQADPWEDFFEKAKALKRG
jgi:bifunctional non-homologous end joining protein LigD